MNVILAVIGVVAVVIVLAAALYVRRVVGCLVNIGMIVVGAVMLLLAIFAGPLGLFDDVETVERLRQKFGLDEQQGPAEQGEERSSTSEPEGRGTDDDPNPVPDLPTILDVPGVSDDPAREP